MHFLWVGPNIAVSKPIDRLWQLIPGTSHNATRQMLWGITKKDITPMLPQKFPECVSNAFTMGYVYLTDGTEYLSNFEILQ